MMKILKNIAGYIIAIGYLGFAIYYFTTGDNHIHHSQSPYGDYPDYEPGIDDYDLKNDTIYGDGKIYAISKRVDTTYLKDEK